MKKQLAEQPSFLTPRQNRRDKFKVYDKGFLGNKQFENIQEHHGERTVHVDPEVIYRLATLGLDRNMIAGFWGITKAKYKELCDEYPILEEVYLMGSTAGIAKAAQKLEDMIEEKQLVPVLFRLKVGGMVEAEKRIGKETNEENAPRVSIFLPDNQRDTLIEDESNDDEETR
jgi:hypothetical protein